MNFCMLCEVNISETGRLFCTSCIEYLEQPPQLHECFVDPNDICGYCDPLIELGIVRVEGEIIVLEN